MVAAFFRAIRPINLLILTLAQGASFALLCLLNPEGTLWKTSAPAFGLLLASTLLICAGGNLINDFLDRKADAVNKTGKNQVGLALPLRPVLLLYAVLTLSGAGIGLWLGLSRHLGWISAIPAAAALVLWAYSRFLQHQPFAGNLAVAVLVSTTVLLPLFFLVDHAVLLSIPEGFTLSFFALLAGLSTWTREWVKDLEDRQGDALAGARTAALVLPVAASKCILYGLAILQVLLVLIPPFNGLLQRLWALVILGGYVVLVRQIHRAEDPPSFHLASQTAKILMVLGISWMAVLAGQLAWFTFSA